MFAKILHYHKALASDNWCIWPDFNDVVSSSGTCLQANIPDTLTILLEMLYNVSGNIL